MPAVLDYRPIDARIWEEELEAFVPPLVLDMHTHLWNDAHRGSASGPPTGLREEADLQALRHTSARLYPGREVHFHLLGTPVPGLDERGHNAWLAAQAAQDPASTAALIVTPATPPERLAAQVEEYGFIGLKPYRLFARDPRQAAIADFLPEALLEVADHLGLAVTLHLSRPAGPADPQNLQDLSDYTRRYPRINWVLAHAARAFNAVLLERALPILKDLPNIWYDTSAVNDLYAHYLLLKHEDRRRIMFGSDNIVAGCMRGKYITYGYAWEGYKGNPELEHCDPTPTLVIYEQLRQQRQAADMLGLSRGEIEDLFSGNAQRFVRQCRQRREKR